MQTTSPRIHGKLVEGVPHWARSAVGSIASARLDLLALGVATALLFLFTIPHLEDFPVPIDDEIWILSASHKLATEGVFGSDLFAGFYRADEVYLFNMPAHHVLLALVFKVLGTSIFIARFVSVLYGVAVLALVYVIGKRLGGRQVALLAVAFLLFLRLGLGVDTGLPLQESARSIRYDLAPVPFMLGAFVCLLNPTPRRVALAGGLLSLGTLFQFYAAFMLPVAVLYLLLEPGGWRPKFASVGILVVAAAAVAAPYGAYALANYDEFQGQVSTLDPPVNLDDPGFYLENLEREKYRFPFGWTDFETALKEKPSSTVSILIGLPLSLLAVAWAALKTRRREFRLLALSLLALPLLLALIEPRKPLSYWVGVLPFLCLGLAVLVGWGLQQLGGWREDRALGRLYRLIVAAGAAAFLVAVLAEGSWAQVRGMQVWDSNSDYMALRATLSRYVPPGSRVLGSTALWWALPETEYHSFSVLFYKTTPRTADSLTTVGTYLDEIDVEYLVLNRTSLWYLQRLGERDERELDEYLKSSERIAEVEESSYGYIGIWKVDRSKRPQISAPQPDN
jgi:4-amino-4-deoxy-L-arabinose transferase-like glycosyltransferase